MLGFEPKPGPQTRQRPNPWGLLSPGGLLLGCGCGFTQRGGQRTEAEEAEAEEAEEAEERVSRRQVA